MVNLLNAHCNLFGYGQCVGKANVNMRVKIIVSEMVAITAWPYVFFTKAHLDGRCLGGAIDWDARILFECLQKYHGLLAWSIGFRVKTSS